MIIINILLFEIVFVDYFFGVVSDKNLYCYIISCKFSLLGNIIATSVCFEYLFIPYGCQTILYMCVLSTLIMVMIEEALTYDYFFPFKFILFSLVLP